MLIVESGVHVSSEKGSARVAFWGSASSVLGPLVPAEAVFTRDFDACIEGVSDDVCLLHVAWANYSGCSCNINNKDDLGISGFGLLQAWLQCGSVGSDQAIVAEPQE